MSSNQFIVRGGRPEDAEQLSVLITELGYPSTPHEVEVRLWNICQNPDYRTLVMADGDKLIGMAGVAKGIWYEKNGTYLRILSFVVSEQYRGRGIGKQLMTSVEDWARELGCNAVVVGSGNRDERIVAHQFYKSQGYENKSSGFIKQL